MKGCSGWDMQPLSTLSASIEHPLKHAGDHMESSHFFDARLLVGGKEESLHAAWASPALRASGREEGYIKKRRILFACKEQTSITQNEISGNGRRWEAIDNRLKYEEREITQNRISGNRRRWEAAQRKSAGN